MIDDQKSFISERSFFANKNVIFAKFLRTPYLSFAGPMLANNTSYKDLFTTCQITPENHGSFLASLLNMQIASRNPFSGHIFLQNLLAHPLQHALWLSPALLHNFRGIFAKISLFIDPGHQQGAHWRKSENQGPLRLVLAKPHFWKFDYCYSYSLVPFSCRTPGGIGWQSFTYNNYNTQFLRNFYEIKCYFHEFEKKNRENFQHNIHVFRKENSLQNILDRSSYIYIK